MKDVLDQPAQQGTFGSNAPMALTGDPEGGEGLLPRRGAGAGRQDRGLQLLAGDRRRTLLPPVVHGMMVLVEHVVSRGYRVFPRTLPDFAVTALVPTPASPRADAVFSVAVTVRNLGAAGSDSGYLDLWARDPGVQA